MKIIYKDKDRPVSERVEDLLSRMTLNQKIRQLTCLMVVGKANPEMFADGIGEVIFFSTEADPALYAAGNRDIQELAKANNPLGIPVIIHAEALTGLVASGCAIFPTSISLGATFDPEIVRDMAERIRGQMLNLGVRQALSPVLDLARDFRWGRTGEDYGSDPTLVAEMACAYIKGLQGENEIIATAKHFLGYSVPEGGLNCSRIQTDSRDIRENFAKPFEAAIRRAGLRSVMNSYGEMNGEAVCASKALLTDLLRGELGFDGIVVSDYMSANALVDALKVAQTPEEAAMLCLSAGLDVELPAPYAYEAGLREAVKRGEFDEEIINLSVRRVLTQKFELGLFDEEERIYIPIDNTEHDKKSLEAAEKVVTLLKNNGILPLEPGKKVAVIGPTADGLRILNNGYTWPAGLEMSLCMIEQERGTMAGIDQVFDAFVDGMTGSGEAVDKSAEVDFVLRMEHPGAKSILEGLKLHFPEISCAKGCTVTGENTSGFEEALRLAGEADAVVLAIGGKVGWGKSCSCGEGIDNTDIALPGVQARLAEEILEKNPNTIVVHTDVKPLVDERIYENAAAVIEAWMPGPFGGEAIANVIAGKTNPGGRLPVDVPRCVGQTPVYYYQRNYSRSDRPSGSIAEKNYRTCATSARFPFGFGLSYTAFEYGEPEWATAGTEQEPLISVSVKVTNTGGVLGDEVIQIYGIDKVASVVRPQKLLVGFKRITLEKGESKTVTFTFRLDQLAFPDKENKWVVEKGEFVFEIAKDADTPLYTYAYEQPETLIIDHTKRGFFAETSVAE
ncbi:MAG: glycoside hydrolase family 3 C-terminal domain-containing protein [Oscillospiraceae bacterium]|jgi:beta-glucosidase|nr:glycoside hydrolase family 3 C-terminal domain-containing protein [Oscillospiraceae bacterium]